MYRIEEIIISWFRDVLKKIRGKNVLIAIPYFWVIMFILFPCLILMKISFSNGVISSPPYSDIMSWVADYTLQLKFNIGNYFLIFTDDMYLRGLCTSLLIAGISTFCCLIIGFAMAMAISRSSQKMRTILLMLVILPFWTSFLIRVYAWILLLSPYGLINNFLMNIGFIKSPLPLMNNSYAACLGIIYAYLPFMIFPLYSAIEKIDYSLIEAAYDLGGTPFTAFFSIIVPLSAPGIYAGSALVFIPAIGEFVIPELLGGSQTLTIGRIVWNEFFGNMSWPTAAALSIMLLLFVVLPISYIQKNRANKMLNEDSKATLK